MKEEGLGKMKTNVCLRLTLEDKFKAAWILIAVKWMLPALLNFLIPTVFSLKPHGFTAAQNTST